MSLDFTTAKPCKECPFVLNRTKGYIGGYTSAQELHQLANSEIEFECHLTMNNDDEGKHFTVVEFSLFVVGDTQDYTDALRNLNDGKTTVDDREKEHYININQDYVEALRNLAML